MLDAGQANTVRTERKQANNKCGKEVLEVLKLSLMVREQQLAADVQRDSYPSKWTVVFRHAE